MRLDWAWNKAANTGREWAATLQAVHSRLTDLNRSTEDAFLNAGRKLQALADSSREVSGRSLRVSQLIGGERLSSAAEELRTLLDALENMRRRAVLSTEKLAATMSAARAVSDLLAGFDEIVCTFRVLGTLARIETVKLTSKSSDFQSLADDVQTLAKDIEERARTMLATAAGLAASTAEAYATSSGVAAVQARDIDVMIGRLRSGLEAFSRRKQMSHEISDRIAATYGGISRAISDLVVSIQFHDITRQRLEHVMHAVEDMTGRLQSGASGRTAALVAGAAALEASQLRDLSTEFRQATDAAVRDLGEMAASVSGMSSIAQEAVEPQDSGGKSFFEEMECGFAAMRATVEHCARADRALAAATRQVGESCGSMTRLMLDMEAIGMGILRIALNTNIKSAHVGSAAAALSVLAGDLQKMAASSMDICERASVQVASLAGQSNSLVDDPQAASGVCAGPEQLTRRIEAVMNHLHRSQGDSAAEFTAIAASGAALSAEIAECIEGFAIRERFTAITAECVSEIEVVSGKARNQAPAEIDISAEMTCFAERYTMHSERELHHGAVQRRFSAEEIMEGSAQAAAAPCGGAVDDKAAGPAADVGLGANAELF